MNVTVLYEMSTTLLKCLLDDLVMCYKIGLCLVLSTRSSLIISHPSRNVSGQKFGLAGHYSTYLIRWDFPTKQYFVFLAKDPQNIRIETTFVGRSLFDTKQRLLISV